MSIQRIELGLTNVEPAISEVFQHHITIFLRANVHSNFKMAPLTGKVCQREPEEYYELPRLLW